MLFERVILIGLLIGITGLFLLLGSPQTPQFAQALWLLIRGLWLLLAGALSSMICGVTSRNWFARVVVAALVGLLSLAGAAWLGGWPWWQLPLALVSVAGALIYGLVQQLRTGSDEEETEYVN